MIVSVNGTAVSSVKEALAALKTPRGQWQVELLRNGQRAMIVVRG